MVREHLGCCRGATKEAVACHSLSGEDRGGEDRFQGALEGNWQTLVLGQTWSKKDDGRGWATLPPSWLFPSLWSVLGSPPTAGCTLLHQPASRNRPPVPTGHLCDSSVEVPFSLVTLEFRQVDSWSSCDRCTDETFKPVWGPGAAAAAEVPVGSEWSCPPGSQW